MRSQRVTALLVPLTLLVAVTGHGQRWRPRPNDCAIGKWAMTPGAWLSQDD